MTLEELVRLKTPNILKSFLYAIAETDDDKYIIFRNEYCEQGAISRSLIKYFATSNLINIESETKISTTYEFRLNRYNRWNVITHR